MTIATPRIGYDSIFDEANVVVSATTDSVGFEYTNAFNWNPSQKWKPASTSDQNLSTNLVAGKEVDYLAIYGHNLGTTGGSYLLQYSSAGDPTSWSDVIPSKSPSDDNVIFAIVSSSVTHPNFRLQITSCTISTTIAHVSIGKTMEIPAEYGLGLGFVPPNLSNLNEYYNPISDKGTPLGRSVKRFAGESRINLSLIDPSWIRNTWKAFMDHTDTKGFFFSWDFNNYSGESAFCWTESKGLSSPTYSDSNLMSASVKFKVLVK